MPWRVAEGVEGCDGYAVVKKDTGKLVACHADKAKAQAQVRALYANEAQTAAAVGELARELLEEAGGLTAARTFDESKIRRYPKGTPVAGKAGGGRFAPGDVITGRTLIGDHRVEGEVVGENKFGPVVATTTGETLTVKDATAVHTEGSGLLDLIDEDYDFKSSDPSLPTVTMETVEERRQWLLDYFKDDGEEALGVIRNLDPDDVNALYGTHNVDAGESIIPRTMESSEPKGITVQGEGITFDDGMGGRVPPKPIAINGVHEGETLEYNGRVGTAMWVGVEPYRQVVGMKVKWEDGSEGWLDWNEGSLSGKKIEARDFGYGVNYSQEPRLPTTAADLERVEMAAAEGYSAADYSDGARRSIAKFLLDEGHTPREAAAIMQSKHMRWASDAADGKPNSRTFKDYYAGAAGNLPDGDWAAESRSLSQDIVYGFDDFGPDAGFRSQSDPSLPAYERLTQHDVRVGDQIFLEGPPSDAALRQFPERRTEMYRGLVTDVQRTGDTTRITFATGETFGIPDDAPAPNIQRFGQADISDMRSSDPLLPVIYPEGRREGVQGRSYFTPAQLEPLIGQSVEVRDYMGEIRGEITGIHEGESGFIDGVSLKLADGREVPYFSLNATREIALGDTISTTRNEPDYDLARDMDQENRYNQRERAREAGRRDRDRRPFGEPSVNERTAVPSPRDLFNWSAEAAITRGKDSPRSTERSRAQSVERILGDIKTGRIVVSDTELADALERMNRVDTGGPDRSVNEMMLEVIQGIAIRKRGMSAALKGGPRVPGEITHTGYRGTGLGPMGADRLSKSDAGHRFREEMVRRHPKGVEVAPDRRGPGGGRFTTKSSSSDPQLPNRLPGDLDMKIPDNLSGVMRDAYAMKPKVVPLGTHVRDMSDFTGRWGQIVSVPDSEGFVGFQPFDGSEAYGTHISTLSRNVNRKYPVVGVQAEDGTIGWDPDFDGPVTTTSGKHDPPMPTRRDVATAMTIENWAKPRTTQEVNAATKRMRRRARGITAAVSIPVAPPLAWFKDPGLQRATPLTVTADGKVYGHLALWDACHIGDPSGPGVCVAPPRSSTGYTLFHLGELETAEGELVPVGKITMGTGHASLQASRGGAVSHYDNTGSVVADVRAGEDRYGIWISGALRPTVSEGQVRELRAAGVSGDWRRYRHALELVAALAVNVPGFPIPRVAALVAPEMEGDERLTLVAAGLERPLVPGPMGDVEAIGRIEALALLAGIGGEPVMDLYFPRAVKID